MLNLNSTNISQIKSLKMYWLFMNKVKYKGDLTLHLC